MIPAAFDYQDPADTERGWDDAEVTRVDECVHGDHPLECASCTSAGFIAAVSGEGGHVDVTNITDQQEMIRGLSTLQLVSLRNAIETELRKRADEYEREAKAARNALGGIKQRATRKDAGMKREEYKAQKGAA